MSSVLMTGVGMIMGVQHYRRGWGVAVGTISGALWGILLAMITVAPRAVAGQILTAQFLIATGIVVLGALLLWRNR